jgi:hypothetical protein
MAHQVGAREGTDDYIAACDYNVRQIVAALGRERKTAPGQPPRDGQPAQGQGR